MMFGGLAQSAPRAQPFQNQAGGRAETLSRKYQAFANPFFDLASTQTPTTVKGLFQYCRHFFLTHGIINAIITKASEYPVTELLLSHRDLSVKKRWDTLMNSTLNYRVHQFEINLEYHVYGNSLISPSLPFTKVLKCASCNSDVNALKHKANWRYSARGFWLSCPKCGQTGYAKARDDHYPKQSELSLVRWNPELVSTFYNEATGRLDHTLDFSPEFKNSVLIGQKDLVATTPEVILSAVNARKTLVFDSNSVFHMRRPGLSGMAGWGVPMLMPVLKDAYFMQIMKKSQESVLLTHLIPQVFLFPQPATSGADPFTTTSLADWRDHIRRELARQRMDPSYFGILPFPLGHQTIGENGKSLLLMPEIQSMAEHICIGMGFPPDLIFGNGTYAGSSVNMRMLENLFLGNIHGHVRLVHWVMRHFGAFLNWEVPDARFKAFRMADDVQRAALLMQLAQQDIVSETTLLSHIDLKVEDETELRMAEYDLKIEAATKKAELVAKIQGVSQIAAAKFQAQAQGAMQSAMQHDAIARKSPFETAFESPMSRPQGFTLDAAAAALADAVKRMPSEQQGVYLSQLRAQLPEMEQMLAQQQGQGLPPEPGQEQQPAVGGQSPANQQQGPQTGNQPGQVNMTPQPEKLPPRRAGAA